jgi:hypothetical protein
MSTINLSFPDQSYSDSNKPSVTTLKSDLTTIETATNALDNENIASDADIAISKTTLGTFTDWTDHVPTFAGFSADPTYHISRYMQLGKLMIYKYVGNADGTSDGTTFTMTIPGTPVLTGGRIDFEGFMVNNDVGGSGGTYMCNATVTSGSTLNLYRITGTFPILARSQAFTNVNGKGIAGSMTLIYEVS